MSFKALLPWWAKIAAKIVLSRMPATYHFWQRLNLFKHGDMECPEYVYNVFIKHYERFNPGKQKSDCVVLELGPGDALTSSVLAPAFGIKTFYLIDTGAYARQDMAPYIQMVEFMKLKGFRIPDVDKLTSVQDVLKTLNANYGTHGLGSLREIPAGSVDFIYSQAVLEHIRRVEFAEMMQELRRILKPDGICSHCVDLRDHLGGALNNLRFSPRAWESDFMAKSGFYTNRIRYTEMMNIFKQAGFTAQLVSMDRWEHLPILRRQLAKEFRSYTDEELCVSGFDVILRPAG